MTTPNPEEYLVKPKRGQKNANGESEKKKIPPKYIAIGMLVGVVLLMGMMTLGSKPSGKKNALKKEAAAGKQEIPVPDLSPKQPGDTPQAAAPGLPPNPAETIAKIDAAIAGVDPNIKAITQQVASVDAELQNYENAAERLGQVGDNEGKRDAERHIAALSAKRKELASQYEKWVKYRNELDAQKLALAGK